MFFVYVMIIALLLFYIITSLEIKHIYLHNKVCLNGYSTLFDEWHEAWNCYLCLNCTLLTATRSVLALYTELNLVWLQTDVILIMLTCTNQQRISTQIFITLILKLLVKFNLQCWSSFKIWSCQFMVIIQFLKLLFCWLHFVVT